MSDTGRDKTNLLHKLGKTAVDLKQTVLDLEHTVSRMRETVMTITETLEEVKYVQIAASNLTLKAIATHEALAELINKKISILANSEDTIRDTKFLVRDYFNSFEEALDDWGRHFKEEK